MVKKPASKKRIAVAEHACEQCAAKRKKIEDVEAEVAVFKKEIDEKNREIEILNAKIDSLKDEMEGATRKIVELQGQKEKHHNALLSREPDGGIDLASKVTELLQRVKQLEKLHNIKTCPTEIYKFKGNESNVCAVLEGKNIFINKDVKSAILDLTTCKQVATQTMMSIFTDEFLQNATVEGKLNGKEGLPKEGLDAILKFAMSSDAGKADKVSEDDIKRGLANKLWTIQNKKKRIKCEIKGKKKSKKQKGKSKYKRDERLKKVKKASHFVKDSTEDEDSTSTGSDNNEKNSSRSSNVSTSD